MTDAAENENRRLMITIEATSECFRGEAIGPELARILRELAQSIENTNKLDGIDTHISLFDAEGNMVGACAIGDVY